MRAPIIETERLILRLPAQQDLEGWAELHGDTEAARYVGGVLPRPVAWRSMAGATGMWSLLGFGPFSVIEKQSGRWIGHIGPRKPEGWPGNEVGWALLRSQWGKGYALEGASAAIDWTFDTLGWTEMIHTIHPDNTASQTLAKRLGSVFLGSVKLPAPFEGEASEAWGQSREDWRKTRVYPAPPNFGESSPDA